MTGSRGKIAFAFLIGTTALACSLGQQARTKPAASQPTSNPKMQVLKDVEYGKAAGEKLLLDLYIPASPKPLPMIVWIHGGGWVGGNKTFCPAALFASRGYAAASVEYRLGPKYVLPAQIQDCKTAIRFLRANAARYNVDPDRIGVWGASAGGHLVAMLGTSAGAKDLEGEGNLDRSSRVQAVCDFFGPTDLVAMGKDFLAKNPNSPNTPIMKVILHDNADAAAKSSPITYVSKDAAPILIVHGDKDKLVPLAQSQLLHDALLKAKADSTLIVVKGAGHGFGQKNKEVFAAVEEFFDKHLKPKVKSAPTSMPAKTSESGD